MQTKLAHPKGTLELHELSSIFPPMDTIEYADLVEDVRENGLREDITLYEGKILDGGNRYRACMDGGIKPTFVNFNPEIDGSSPAAFVMAKNFKRRHLSASQKAAIATAMLPFYEVEAAERKAKGQFKAKDATPVVTVTPVASNVVAADFGTETVPPTVEHTPAATPAPGAAATPAPAPAEDASKKGKKLTPAPKAGPKTGTAAEAVAKVFGTSETMVRLAKRVQKADADLFAEVINGKVTVNAAIEIIDARERAKKEDGKKAEEEKAFQDALVEIGDKYGMESEIFKSIKGRKVLKKKADVPKFAAMTVKATKAIIHLLAFGWDLDKAMRYLEGKITTENTVEDCFNVALAKGKPNDEPYQIVVGNWVMSLKLND